ncbi:MULTISPECIES: holo-ACP synthase [Tenebrionibacter/Tenebrionicola group]|jgi:holo-[acyl-carrier protein] synthase|uniref:Holo-[acyl-carrier-protein] synthase n=2 Tax=Tenebrionibacter/Tenebrionicola group TaxID=2969848 RepID=A0A8K0V4J9_9ENTR|nr:MULTISPECIES: holo-ACP synthase [Tenebrionibacter/Tenebrionicola group]MBK4715273.1 holo-ACP synthase [Tenebrionibacter intestinalis]MBV4413065.1 holo-ACP synthase [Tenebrionicola larvae]MBV5096019.1 holo-ACP synthase [Tenebrionicola larvae]
MFVGTDIVEVNRIRDAIQRGNMDFLRRVFTEREILKIRLENPDYERASGFWAAKESIVKAVGLGFRNGILFHDAEVTHDEYGCPRFLLTGKLKEILEERKLTKITLSISHCRTHAVAVTIIA